MKAIRIETISTRAHQPIAQLKKRRTSGFWPQPPLFSQGFGDLCGYLLEVLTNVAPIRWDLSLFCSRGLHHLPVPIPRETLTEKQCQTARFNNIDSLNRPNLTAHGGGEGLHADIAAIKIHSSQTAQVTKWKDVIPQQLQHSFPLSREYDWKNSTIAANNP